jgi:hypothetical protein
MRKKSEPPSSTIYLVCWQVLNAEDLILQLAAGVTSLGSLKIISFEIDPA